MSTVEQTVTFIQYDIPPLKAGEYTLTATQTVNQISPNTFTTSKQFAVPGNRFSLNGDEIVSVFPQPLANGEFTGVMPLALLKTQTLPWQRTSVTAEMDAPWMTILLLQESDFPDGIVPPVQPATAAELFALGTQITAYGSSVTGTGTMPAGILSYPNMNPLDYGQTPSDPCSIVDLPVAMFSQIAPSAADLPFLAHIRQTDLLDSEDNEKLESQWAIVLGNRWPKANANAYAFLVSLENMGDLLPDDDGNPSKNIPSGTTHVRLIVFRTWRYFANDLDEKFASIVENLNKNSAGQLGLTTLRLDAPTPASAAVATALQNQATGALTAADAAVLVQNGLCMGYTAINHHLREAGHTVSWYRGPLVPYDKGVQSLPVPAACPDALLNYDPQEGLFDTSYAAAWQLGQLLALQSSAFSVALYNWKQSLTKADAAQAEHQRLVTRSGGKAFQSLLAQRLTTLTQTQPLVPADIAAWIGRLKLLIGVPFAYLVSDERMLPVESLRFFYLDQDWISALVDGAFSIGRNGSKGAMKDAAPLAQARTAGRRSARLRRKNNKPELAARSLVLGDTDFSVVSGFLLRSQVVSGWPRLNVNGYADTAGITELVKLRMDRLSNDVILCLFEGAIQMLAIHEAPEQLHCGVEGAAPNFTTTLREVNGDTPGQQYTTDPKGGEPVAALSVRADQQTLKAADSATAICTKLNNDFDQNITNFTSAEFALEMVKGVVKVEFIRQS